MSHFQGTVPKSIKFVGVGLHSGRLVNLEVSPQPPNTGIFFQFVFKGFSSVGHSDVGSTLSKSIPGYQWRGDKF